jgi:hypothetical protein
MKRKAKRPRTPAATRMTDLAAADVDGPGEAVVGQGGSPRLSAGDVDADWRRAESVGEEGVGGTVSTPDQDVVDEIGRALGVEQASDAEVRSAEELLRDRDQRRWQLVQKAAEETRSP